ncbi:histone deacetylase family protein [Bacterioplanoides sp.]|uniref:histone deacetylase family protein n=1 Tax=Bacterioplanoides sp. TaxID=2066072 RepID=UPI003B59F945
MTTAYYTFEQHFAHNTGDDHPEHAMRLLAIEQGLKQSGLWQELDIIQGSMAHTPDILRAHSHGYYDQLQLIQPEQGHIYVDEDTPMAPGSLEAALYSVGTCTQALDDVLHRDSQHCNAFVGVRPPGHHAEHKKSKGFCFFNNIAICGLRAADIHHLQRVLIIDFDAHQCNGTIDILANDQRFLICSSFQHPFYPNSHYQVGLHNNVLNVPMDAGTGSQEFRDKVTDAWDDAIRKFAPELILVSAGFDAHEADPMAELNLQDNDYTWLGNWIGEIAANRNTPVLSLLEGGYDLNALARSVVSYIRAMQ